MSSDPSASGRPSLRRYLLTWFAGVAILVVIAYTQLLEYYLELGIGLRSQSILEQAAEDYAEDYALLGVRPALPTAPGLGGYTDVNQIPADIFEVFAHEELKHGEVLRFTNLDFDAQDRKQFEIDTLNFCPEGNCELLFLYPYKLQGDDWLYLLHGVVGSEEIYDELEFTDQFAFAIGFLFTALLLVVAFLIIRDIDRPLRRLNQWSASQTVEASEQPIPDLKFQELEELAKRIRFAFDRMREGVNSEKLFLRHASHELRTPIAILSSNNELLDRLTDRPDRSEAEQAAFVRQYRALEDIQLLMETLLWINRQSDNLPSSESIDLRHELDTVIKNFDYLLDKRDVNLVVEGAGDAVVPVAAARIVLSNLVRNAFQYTVEGEVRITVQDREVSVENSSVAALEPGLGGEASAQSEDSYGFGLGLELVALICGRFDWLCTTRQTANGRVTSVTF
ncbi:MAG: hypothetical protein AAF541_13460 [Pseudomonadota bacterium]